MMQFQIISVGGIKEKHLKDGIFEYAKRIQKYAKLEVIEISESRLPDNPNEKQIEKALSEEAKQIIDKIPEQAFVVTLEIEGKQLSSIDFSAFIEKNMTYESSKMVFIIGSSFGLSSMIKEKSQFKLSFSLFTFPHQLMRFILVEQLYRALTIMKNTSYHK
ncbi:MAG: 23S rRNA (pseudouridine(1915)-N(3))-methyltransferase RlmH [Candidatus Izemoplasmatales bacterium]|nr:23S rRNA (pseudouridine(1915)-N(3))-methyltransferase RlmH [Candidatus Izemoplasmatales bacterium]